MKKNKKKNSELCFAKLSWNNFASQDFGSSSGAIWGTGKYYPAAGMRDASEGGALKNVGAEGNVWSATAKTDNVSAYSLYFKSYYIDSHTYWLQRGNGFSVRCVKE